MTKPLKVKHSYNCGDLIASLPGLKHIYETTGRQTILYQELDFPAFYYDGAEHPIKNSEGQQVSMNEATYNNLWHLLKDQEYIQEMLVWFGEEVDIDLMQARDRRHIPLPFGSIFQWPFMAFPDLSCDLSKPWIKVDDSPNKEFLADKIIINRTSRYTNPYISYFFLKEYEDQLIFIGTPEERQNFNKKYDLNIAYLYCGNFYQYAQAIQSCKFFIGNQSFFWHVANALGKTSILEVCSTFPNCWPTTNGYAALYQNAMEHFADKLLKIKTPELVC